MLNLTPTNYGSLGHGKLSPQTKAAVTTFKGAHLLKWLAAYCVLDNVGAAGSMQCHGLRSSWPVDPSHSSLLSVLRTRGQAGARTTDATCRPKLVFYSSL